MEIYFIKSEEKCKIPLEPNFSSVSFSKELYDPDVRTDRRVLVRSGLYAERNLFGKSKKKKNNIKNK